MTKMKPPTKAQIEASEKHKREKAIKKDIQKINDVMNNNDDTELISLHRLLDGKYQTVIIDWGKSMWGYSNESGFNYLLLDADSIKENLSLMGHKLEAFLIGLNDKRNFGKFAYNSGINVTINNSNIVDVEINFEEIRQKIEDMPGLNNEDTEEIKSKIDELENISKESISKKKKWEKVKPILLFVIDKGADVAISIMPLILQMKLGM